MKTAAIYSHVIPVKGFDALLQTRWTGPALFIIPTGRFPSGEMNRMVNYLSERELERSRKFLFREDRGSYIITHGLLRAFLGRYLMECPSAVEIRYTAAGKPVHAGNPPQIHFNLSHSSGISLLAFDLYNEIGADVEKIRQDFDYILIMEKYFTGIEKRYVNETSIEKVNRFFEVWTRKEALLKATGEGITRHLGTNVIGEVPLFHVPDDRKTPEENPGFRLDTMIFRNDHAISVATTEKYETAEKFFFTGS